MQTSMEPMCVLMESLPNDLIAKILECWMEWADVIDGGHLIIDGRYLMSNFQLVFEEVDLLLELKQQYGLIGCFDRIKIRVEWDAGFKSYAVTETLSRNVYRDFVRGIEDIVDLIGSDMAIEHLTKSVD